MDENLISQWAQEDAQEIENFEKEIAYYQARKKLFLFDSEKIRAITEIITMYRECRRKLIGDYEQRYGKAYIGAPKPAGEDFKKEGEQAGVASS